uniref:protein disulfide isomerase Creld1-like isoform X1 n=1 Tax=Myxine glutinosa TaxID=7769 RepID=UPI00358F3C90
MFVRLVLVLWLCQSQPWTAKAGETCYVCRRIVHTFAERIQDTAKKNFGGGNTAWEEKRLSRYHSSETRLVEIMESLCEGSDFACTNMLERSEELLEKWWFKKQKQHPDLHKWFCIDATKSCCPNGTFGPDCDYCLGGSVRPCAGNGRCDGQGTRSGTGLCVCDVGYAGEECLECEAGFYALKRNDTYANCSRCHTSCTTCSGPEVIDCEECQPGFEKDVEHGCIDVDECVDEVRKCKVTQFCSNTVGSYTCSDCDESCVGCTAPGNDRCARCKRGYHLEEDQCVDVDECINAPCKRENEVCVNTNGGFLCECAYGFHDKGDLCVKSKPSGEQGLMDEISTDELMVLKQMFIGVMLCALATLAAKGDMVYTSLLIGALAATFGYWLSEHGDRIMNDMISL